MLLHSGVSEARQAVLIADQLVRIEAALANATDSAAPPTWLLVVGHYPVFSPGSHGDTDELQTYLLPLLEQYKVDAYFCGHDHLSAHLT
jgi:3',5'-cyclic AMP phosphodiesterase CpdA